MVFTQKVSKIRQGGTSQKAVSDLPLANLFCPRCGDQLFPFALTGALLCYSCGHGGTLPLGITHAEDTLGDYHQVASNLAERRAA